MLRLTSLRWIWPALWMASIFATSSTYINSRQLTKAVAGVAPGVTESNFANFWDSWWWLFVKGWHFLEFLVLFGLSHFALKGNPHRKLLALLITACYACFDEWHQTFVRSRGGLVTDVLIDVSGALAACGVISICEGIRARKALRA